MSILKDEIVNDPLGRGYSTMTDQQIADSINGLTRTRNRNAMTGSEIANQIVVSEFNGLSAAQEQLIWNILHLGELNPFGIETAMFVSVFGIGSATISNLQAARIEAISRADELGLGRIKIGHVEEARRS